MLDAVLLLAAVQDGGLMPWHKDPPQAAMEDAKTRGLPVMLYFTSAG